MTLGANKGLGRRPRGLGRGRAAISPLPSPLSRPTPPALGIQRANKKPPQAVSVSQTTRPWRWETPLDSSAVWNSFRASRPSRLASIGDAMTLGGGQPNAQLYLVGLPDEAPGHTYHGADAIRQALFHMTSTAGAEQVTDLGNLKGPFGERDAPHSVEKAVQNIVQEVHNQNQTIVLFGSADSYELPQYQGYTEPHHRRTILGVHNQLSVLDPHAYASLAKLVRLKPNTLFHYIHLAHQRYLVRPEDLELFESFQFEAIRLGEIRENLRDCEPQIRAADMMSFHIAAMANHYAPAAPQAHNFGLSGEEACQIAWYAGMNQKLNSLGIYGYQAQKDNPKHTTAHTIATMIWYFIEAHQHPNAEPPFQPEHCIKYSVQVAVAPHEMTFYKRYASDKWWMQIPTPKLTKPAYIPCSYQDYLAATRGEIPKRWILMHKKLN